MNKRISMCIGISMTFLLLSAGCGSTQEETPEVSNNVVSENVTVSESLTEEETVSSEEPVTYPIITQYTYAESYRGEIAFGNVCVDIPDARRSRVFYTEEKEDFLKVVICDSLGGENPKSHLVYLEVGYWNCPGGVNLDEIVQELEIDGNYSWLVFRNEQQTAFPEYYELNYRGETIILLPENENVYCVESDRIGVRRYLGIEDYELVYLESEGIRDLEGNTELSVRGEYYPLEEYYRYEFGENIDGKTYEVVYNFQNGEQNIEVYNGEGERIQYLVWDHYHMMENLSFADYNFDGYLDMSVPTAEQTRVGAVRRIYLWDAESEQFVPTECEWWLTSFVVREHQIWDWYPASGGGTYLTILEWNGNCLEMISQEHVMPDGNEKGDTEE